MLIPTNFAAESSSGLGALGVDGRAFLVQLITFILVFLVLKRYAFQPILRVLQERREMVESGVRLGEEMQKQRVKLEKEIEKALHDARRQADDILSTANDAGRQAIRDAEEKARAKAGSIIESAEGRIVQDTIRTRRQLEKELVGLVAEATEAVIEEKIDAKKDAQLIERALKEGRPA